MADDAIISDQDVADISLIDTPIEQPGEAEPSTPADKPQEGADTQAEQTKEVQPDAADTTAEEKTPPTEPEATVPDQRAEQQRRAATEYQNRQRTRQQIANDLDQTYGPKTEEQLIEEGMPQQQASLQALREEMAYEKQRTQIAELNAGIQVEAVNVVNDFSVFNPKSKDYDAEFEAEVAAAYKTAARVQYASVGTNPDGSPREVITNAEVPLYDFYQRMAKIYSRGESKRYAEGQADGLQTLARTEDAIGGSSSTNKNSNDFAAMEERLGDVVIT